ncbi:MAG: hypothetical protein ACREEW_07265 [Caulobacteraceae bacterium]
MTNQAGLREALGDVRRAYRLLWCYQDRLFDIIRAIAGEFDSLKFYVWQPNSAARIDGTTNPLTRSPWFAFPMMNVSYLYRSGDDPNYAKAGDWLLDIRVISDSGFDDSNDSRLTADPDDFPGIEATSSRINLYAFYFVGDIKGNLLRDVWNQLEWPATNGEVGEPTTHSVRTLGMTFDIAELGDKDAVLAATRTFKNTASAAFGAVLS